MITLIGRCAGAFGEAGGVVAGGVVGAGGVEAGGTGGLACACCTLCDTGWAADGELDPQPASETSVTATASAPATDADADRDTSAA
jgi:hypothetical protein